MKLHWSPKSPFVRKVMVCAHELGVVPRLTLMRSVAAMTQPNPQIMADNPLSKIPTLVREDGSTLFDSVVICEYLNDQAQGALFPPAGAIQSPGACGRQAEALITSFDGPLATRISAVPMLLFDA